MPQVSLHEYFWRELWGLLGAKGRIWEESMEILLGPHPRDPSYLFTHGHQAAIRAGRDGQ